MLRCLYPANDTFPAAPCHGGALEERLWAGGDGAIVYCCPTCEVIYFERDENNRIWEVVLEEEFNLLVRIGPCHY